MNLKKHFKVHYWPQLTAAWFILTFIVTFTISVSDGHVYIYFPYISDTGAVPPESCIFGILINIGAGLFAITLYIRYRQVDLDICSGNIDLPKKWNLITKWMPFFMCLGLLTSANFQETAIFVIHTSGAGLMFGIGMVYFLIQTRISFSTRRETNLANPEYGISNKMFYLRVFLSFSAIPLIAIIAICGSISLMLFTGKTIIWWTEEDGGFQLRLAATFSEWILVMFTLSYIFTFRHEFRTLKYEEIQFTSRARNVQDVAAKTKLGIDIHL